MLVADLVFLLEKGKSPRQCQSNGADPPGIVRCGPMGLRPQIPAPVRCVPLYHLQPISGQRLGPRLWTRCGKKCFVEELRRQDLALPEVMVPVAVRATPSP